MSEMGPVDDFDWSAAEAVRCFDAVGAGHLVHMPTHSTNQVHESAQVGINKCARLFVPIFVLSMFYGIISLNFGKKMSYRMTHISVFWARPLPGPERGNPNHLARQDDLSCLKQQSAIREPGKTEKYF